MNEGLFHRSLLTLAGVGLVVGAAAYVFDWPVDAGWIWAAAVVPVIAALAISILRDFWIGRIGVDAIALLSMAGALALDEPFAAVVIAMMYSGGNVLEDFARGRAEHDLRSLTDRTPRVAHRKASDGIVDVPVAQVAIGDELLVRAGEVLPVDGELLDTSATIDESALTGEPIPATRRKGETLRSGTVNAGEAFRFRATAQAGASTYAGIVRMVEAAQTAKAPFMRMADRFALLLLPATLVVAGAAWWGSGDPVRALAVLVVATPCPLILAAPVAFIGGVSRAAKAGVLMKGSAALEALAGIRTAVFDKTGTLTEGGAKLLCMKTAPGVEADEALRLVASLEQASHHVLAETLIATARARGLPLSQPSMVQEHRGSGIEGLVDGRKVRAGSRSLVCAGMKLPDWAEGSAAASRHMAALTLYLSVDGKLAAVLVMGDEIRPDTPKALQGLRDAGVSRMIMVTGDNEAVARAVAAELDLDEVLAERSPAEKVDAVLAETAVQPTMMVGDGINDAPALAAASLGIAMGARGATASSEAADVVVLVDRLDRVAQALAIAQRTRSIALQSIVVGLALSGAGMVAAAFGYLTPVAGALFQEAIDVAVIVNALRALGPGQLWPVLQDAEAELAVH
ncbi:heavy metal translocating P-type ATPase [Mesorhizobium sp. KR2-14]|uniref:heavy metal translocating P-type ATPase n=1 Tax=Mesorhizobium sp. KR2-14 TaxID=3156610 RepID=UPI0032B4C5E8